MTHIEREWSNFKCDMICIHSTIWVARAAIVRLPRLTDFHYNISVSHILPPASHICSSYLSNHCSNIVVKQINSIIINLLLNYHVCIRHVYINKSTNNSKSHLNAEKYLKVLNNCERYFICVLTAIPPPYWYLIWQ